MPSARDFAIRYLNLPSKVLPTRPLITSTGQRFVLPFYHAISDKKLRHIDHLYRSKSTKEFINDLEFLLRYFTPVDHVQFKEIVASGSHLRKPVFLISFDDGLREFHDIVAPILLKKGIPAVCFLNSAFIDNRELFFKYKASVLISHLKENKDLYNSPQVKDWMTENSIAHIENWLLSIDYANKEKLDELALQMGYRFDEYLSWIQPYLTTNQIEKLIDDGFHFGAHSIDHPEYRFIAFEEQIRQTTESMNYVKNRFGLDYSLFAFPFTDFEVTDKFFTTIAANRLADLTFGSAGLKKERYSFHFQRVTFERGGLSAGEIYKTEVIYSAMQSLIGKIMIKRA